MTLDQKQKQFWNRHAKRNNNPRDANAPVLLGAFLSRSSEHHHDGRVVLPQHPPEVLHGLVEGPLGGDVGVLFPVAVTVVGVEVVAPHNLGNEIGLDYD